jgi:hypothetical protein
MQRILFFTLALAVAPLRADLVNVALAANGGVASASSLAGTFPQPGRINDGNYSSIESTAFQANAWWQVSFDDSYFVSIAKIYNEPRDCCKERINNFSLFLYDSNDEVVWQSLGNSIPASSVDQIATFSGINTWGKRMRVQLEHTQNLALREFEVFADVDVANSPTVVPEPSTYALLGTAIAVLAGLARKKRGSA